jgi:uncharacterized protein (DUF2132 family)
MHEPPETDDDTPRPPDETRQNAPKRNPLHGVTLEMMLVQLVEKHGWEAMGRAVEIRCFQENPSIKSSLNFLRRTPWARAKVEHMYLTNDLRPAWKRRGRGAGGRRPKTE